MLNFNTPHYDNEDNRTADAFIEANTSSYLYKKILAKDLNIDVEDFINNIKYLKLRLEQCDGQKLALEELQETKTYVKAYDAVKSIIENAEAETQKLIKAEKTREQQIAYFLEVTLPKLVQSKKMNKLAKALVDEANKVHIEIDKIDRGVDGLTLHNKVQDSLNGIDNSSLIYRAIMGVQ